VEVLEDRLAPATLTVNSTADTASPTDPYLSLREAVAIVNSPTLPSGLSDQILAQISGTLHGGTTDTIVFDPSAVRSPITLGGTQLHLSLPRSTASVSIDGGSGVTIDGNNASRILLVDNNAEAMLDHLLLIHGYMAGNSTDTPGGAIDNLATLTVSNSTISSSSAAFGGGLSNAGTMTVNNSTITSNTGGGFFNFPTSTLTINGSRITSNSRAGIYNHGRVTVTGSTLALNTYYYGGAIYTSGGIVTLSDSTITANSATYRGGGIDASVSTLLVNNCTIYSNTTGGDGGGIFNEGASVAVSGSTLSSNSASSNGGGVYNGSFGLAHGSIPGTLNLVGSTLASNSPNTGGAIYNFSLCRVTSGNSTLSENSANTSGGGILNNGGTIHLQNTIVARGSGASSPDISGDVDSTSSNNLVGNGGGLSGISDGLEHNQIGTSANPLDPRLTPLGYYGGSTQTYALLPGSPARNTGDPAAASATDQRGLPGIVSSSCDIGAFQTQFDPFLVTTLLDPGRLTGYLSLREAVTLSNVLSGSNSVSFDPALATGTVTLTAGELLLGSNLSITGPMTVSGNNASRVFEVAASVSASLTRLTIANGLVSSSSLAQGGGILEAGSLTLTDCTVTNNQAAGSLTGTGSENAFAEGGAIYTLGTLTLLRCTVTGNSVTLSAGNIYYGNANGGGIYASGAVVTLSNSTVAGNSATATFTGGTGLVFGYGGGLTSDNGTLTLTGCTMAGNTATGGNAAGYGGGLHSFQSTVSLGNCTIANNNTGSASDAGLGGGVSDFDSTFTLTSCTITGNAATSLAGTGTGGGIYYNSGAGSVQVLNTIVAGNSSQTDGPDASGTFSSLGSNLIGITDGSSGWGGSDLTGTASSPLDPLLGALGSYGGPTWTVPLLAGSPALNAGDPSQRGSTDQRGVVRTGGVNIGAFQGSASAFVLAAPATAIAGTPFDVTVAVYDIYGQLAIGYAGTIHVSTTDPDPGVVLPSDYTFQISDGGVVTFPAGVTLLTSGQQTLTVTDPTSGITGSTLVTL
jgi:hypothetical protein